jgi:hypothetical protein
MAGSFEIELGKHIQKVDEENFSVYEVNTLVLPTNTNYY